MENWIGILGTLGGVLLGGVITYVIGARQRAHERQLVLNKRQLEKLESAHEILSKIAIIERKLLTETSFLMSTSLGPPTPTSESERLPIEELEMLFSFYIPSLEERAKELITICHDFGASYVMSRINPPVEKDARKRLWDEVAEKYNSIDVHIKALKIDLAEIVKQHAT